MTVTEEAEKKEEEKRANGGWLMAALDGSKQLPIRLTEGERRRWRRRRTCAGGLARVGIVFSVFIGRKEWLSEPVMESRHVSVVHTPAEPAAFPVTPVPSLMSHPRDFLSFSFPLSRPRPTRPAPAS